jgi:hypothetical protein
MKKKVAFALIMGVVTTGLISFILITVNLGFTPNFLMAWLRSWLIAYLLAVPAILVIAPQVERFVDFLLRETAHNAKRSK